MATFTKAPMPRANQFINPDGSLTVPALNYLGNLEKMATALAGINGSDDAFLATASAAIAVPPLNVTDVTLAASKAGATWLLAELSVAMDEIKGTTIPAFNANIAMVQATMNQILAALTAANLMEP